MPYRFAGLAMPLTLSLAIAGCAAAPDADVPVDSVEAADTSIPPETQHTGAKLGSGWDKSAETLKAQCMTSNTVHVGQREGTILSDRSVDTLTVDQELGLSFHAKGRYTMSDASLASTLSQSMKEDSYSEVFLFKADYKLGYDSLDENTLHNTPPGDDAQHAAAWQDRCGDEVVYQIKNGAKLYFLERIDFVSAEAKSRFDADAHVSFDSGIASGQVDAVLNQIGSRYAKSARVHIEVYQFGGDVSALGAVVNGTGGSASGGRAMVDCDMTNLAACRQVRANAVAYTDPSPQNIHGLYAQLQDPRYATNPVSYETKPWSLFGRNTTPRIITQQINTYRNQLEAKFDSLMKWKLRIDRILVSLAGFGGPDAQKNVLRTWQARLNGDIGVVNQAVVACYDNLTFDPAGQPLAAKVTACLNAVAAVPDDVPPQKLLTAAGRYAIDYRWQQLGGVNGAVGDYKLGFPDALAVGRDLMGLVQMFNRGQIFWSPDTDAHEVYGYILEKYLALGGANPNGRLELGFPLTGEQPAKSPGRYNHFQGGSIYWSPATGAHIVWGLIRDLWGNQGWERSQYGYPKTDEIWEQNGDWRYNEFQGGYVYYNDTAQRAGRNSIFQITGQVANKFREWKGWMGYPLMNTAAPTIRRNDGVQGTFQNFQNGAIFVHPTYGAHMVVGAIYGKWREKGFELGETLDWVSNARLGYPVSDEQPVIKFSQEVGRVSYFEGGAIYWSNQAGAHIIAGAFWSPYQQRDAASGICGFPVDEPGWHTVTFGRNYYRQNFTNGYMKVFPSDNNRTEVHCPSDGD
jgi:hypothetical protein